MFRKLAFLVVLVVLVAAAFASAASLSVTGGSIQAGMDTALYCDADGVQVAGWGLETTDNKVYFVKLTGIDPACNGNNVFVDVEGNGDAIGLIAGSADPLVFRFQPAVDATGIETLRVWIDGAK